MRLSKSEVKNSKIFKKYKRAFKELHAYPFWIELRDAMEIRPLDGLEAKELSRAFGWRESPQGVQFWKEIANKEKELWIENHNKKKELSRTKSYADQINDIINEDEPVKYKVEPVNQPEEKELEEVHYIITPVNVCFSWDGEEYTADVTSTNFQAIVKALLANDAETAIELVDVAKAITNYMKGHVVVDQGVVTYRGMEIKGGMTSRIVDAMASGDVGRVSSLVAFFENLMENPSNRAVNELFGFLEATDIKITEDGKFIAWKKVKSNYHDIYTGKIDNSPCRMVYVPRNMVDEDSERTCSHGLHVCSRSYLSQYGNAGSNKVVSCLVNPRDVVAVPKDYKNAKMRVCAYKVIRDVTDSID